MTAPLRLRAIREPVGAAIGELCVRGVKATFERVAVDRMALRESTSGTTDQTRKAVAIGIVVAVALLHAFRVGSYLSGSLHRLYYSYFSDIVVPFAAYFLLYLVVRHWRSFGDWRTKAAVVLGVASFAEVMQGVGVPLLGRTFDPLDFLMYAVGVLLAVLVDQVLLDRVLPGWSSNTDDGSNGSE